MADEGEGKCGGTLVAQAPYLPQQDTPQYAFPNPDEGWLLIKRFQTFASVVS